jgi:hypothetical protein
MKAESQAKKQPIEADLRIVEAWMLRKEQSIRLLAWVVGYVIPLS